LLYRFVWLNRLNDEAEAGALTTGQSLAPLRMPLTLCFPA
jgi:hypothetical protein